MVTITEAVVASNYHLLYAYYELKAIISSRTSQQYIYSEQAWYTN